METHLCGDIKRSRDTIHDPATFRVEFRFLQVKKPYTNLDFGDWRIILT